MTVDDLSSFDPGQQGCTNMAGVFECLQAEVSRSNPRVRVLALSDGEVHDSAAAKKAAGVTAMAMKEHFEIEARAVRYFTSRSQPDTTALASVLDFNTESAAQVLDIQGGAGSDLLEVADAMAGMFPAVHAGNSFRLEATSSILMAQPWNKAKRELRLKTGNNTFWLTTSIGQLTLDGVELKVEEGAVVTPDSLDLLLSDRMSFIISQIKVLKVIDSPEAREKINIIANYFRNLTATMGPAQDLSHLLAGLYCAHI